MRVLVTGMSGFTGQHLAAALRAHGLEPVDAERVNGRFDLTDPASVGAVVEAAQADYVIHLAAISFVAHGDPSDFYRVNTIGTTHLLDALAKPGRTPRKIILASSANVYGNATVEPITEDVPPAPTNHYACSKLAMEHMARQWVDRLPIIITRPFNYTGPGQDERFLIPKIVAHCARRAPTISLGNIDVVRDFSDVRTVVEAYCRLLLAPVTGGTFNVCSGRGYSVRDILALEKEVSGHAPQVQTDLQLVRTAEVMRLVGSNGSLRAAVGELPRLELSDTLARMTEHSSKDMLAIGQSK